MCGVSSSSFPPLFVHIYIIRNIIYICRRWYETPLPCYPWWGWGASVHSCAGSHGRDLEIGRELLEKTGKRRGSRGEDRGEERIGGGAEKEG